MTGSWHEYDTPKDLFQVTYFFQVDPISKVSRTSKIVPSSGDKASNKGIFWREALHIQTIQWFEKHIWEMLFHMNILRLLFWKWYRFTTDLGWSREYTNTTVMEKRSSENLSPVTRKQGALCSFWAHTRLLAHWLYSCSKAHLKKGTDTCTGLDSNSSPTTGASGLTFPELFPHPWTWVSQ